MQRLASNNRDVSPTLKSASETRAKSPSAKKVRDFVVPGCVSTLPRCGEWVELAHARLYCQPSIFRIDCWLARGKRPYDTPHIEGEEIRRIVLQDGALVVYIKGVEYPIVFFISMVSQGIEAA